MAQIDPESELKKLEELPLQERPEPVAELVDRLEQELDDVSPAPSEKA